MRDISSHRRFPRDIGSNETTNYDVASNLSVTQPTPANHLVQQSNATNHNMSSESAELFLGHRIKRQSPGREQLCQTTYQYITPQAALNSQGITLAFFPIVWAIWPFYTIEILLCREKKKNRNEHDEYLFTGNWMYIVNQIDATRQLVRTETCA